MIFYVSLLGIFIGFYLVHFFMPRNVKHIFVLLLIFLLVLVSGTRYELGGSDYFVYQRYFNALPTLYEARYVNELTNFQSILYVYEPGFTFFNILIKSIGFNYYGYTLIQSFIFYSFFYLAFKQQLRIFPIIFLIFLYKIFFYNTFISMRQSLSLVIFLFSLRYIFHNKFYHYVIAIFIATSFHFSAFLLFPFYFLSKVKFSRKSMIIFAIMFIPTLLTPLLINFLVTWVINGLSSLNILSYTNLFRLNVYLAYAFSQSLDIFHTLEFFLVFGLIIINYDYVSKMLGKKANLYFSMMIALLVIFTLFRGIIIITRIKDYFILFYAVIFGVLLTKNTAYRFSVSLGLILVVTFGYIRFLVLFDDGGLLPYQSYLFLENFRILR